MDLSPLSDTVVLVDKRLLTEDEPVFFVLRSAAGHWVLRRRNFLDHADADLVRSTFGMVAKRDPSVHEIADLPPGWQAWRDLDAESSWERCESPTGPTFLVEFEARPAESHPEQSRYRGAFVNCYVRCQSLEEARQRACAYLEAEHWNIIEENDSYEISLQTYDQGEDAREYFRQAQIDGSVFVFHTYMLE